MLAKFAVLLQIKKKKSYMRKGEPDVLKGYQEKKKKKTSDVQVCVHISLQFPTLTALILVSPVSGQCFTMGMLTVRKNSSALRNGFIIWPVFFFLS